MVSAASWVLDTGVQDHRADVLKCPPAELAGEIAGNIAVERLVVAAVRIVYARVQKKRPQARVPLTAVYAVERATSIALKQSVIAALSRMVHAGITKKRRRIAIFLPTELAVFTHGITPCLIL